MEFVLLLCVHWIIPRVYRCSRTTAQWAMMNCDLSCWHPLSYSIQHWSLSWVLDWLYIQWCSPLSHFGCKTFQGNVGNLTALITTGYAMVRLTVIMEMMKYHVTYIPALESCIVWNLWSASFSRRHVMATNTVLMVMMNWIVIIINVLQIANVLIVQCIP